MKALQIQKLIRRFGDLTAVDNVDITILEGEIYGLLGPNGAGKSTTINIICGLLKQDTGTVSVFGQDTLKQANATKSMIGVVPQDIAIYLDLTALENVMFFAGLYGLKGKELTEKSMEALAFVGLTEHAKKFPKTFSGGMKRRLNIACAIAHGPKLIIMDEPTVGIDPQSRNHILQSVLELNRRGSTIIYTSHYMEEVEEVCGRIAIMDHGKVIAEGTRDELKAIISDTGTVFVTLENPIHVKLDALLAIDGVRDAELTENIVRITSDHDIRNLDRIIKELSSCIIRNVENTSPDLETVFLSLTGRKLRD